RRCDQPHHVGHPVLPRGVRGRHDHAEPRALPAVGLDPVRQGGRPMTVTEPGSTDTTPVELITLTIDDVEVSVPKGTLVIRAAELIGTEIPRFCDHPLLAPVGACRQCLVEVPDAGNGRPMPKPQASCTLEASPGMVVRT